MSDKQGETGGQVHRAKSKSAAGLAEALSKHWLDDNPGCGVFDCACGEWRYSGTYEEHLAAIVTAWFAAELGTDDMREAVAEALDDSPNGPWLTLPGPTRIAPGLATAALAAITARLTGQGEA